MMPYIRITPLPSVNIQIVKETFRNRLHEKKTADHKRYQNFIMWPALNCIHSSHILVLLLLVFMHVNTRIEFFEGFFLSSCLCYLLDSGTLLGSHHKIQENFDSIPSGNFGFFAVSNEFKNIHTYTPFL